MLEGKTFLITGATGRLGCALTQRLEELGANVLPLVIGRYPDRPKRIDWASSTIPIRINRKYDLKKIPEPDYVINCHWQVNRKLSFTKQLVYEISNNIHLLNFIWEWLLKKRIDSFTNISSIRIFSHLNNNPVSSDTEPFPIFPYGISKVTGEKFLDAYFSDSLFPVTHLRLCSVMSSGEHPSHLMSQLYSSAFRNKQITINTGHMAYLIYIDEAIDLIINATQTAERKRYLLTKPGIKIDKITTRFEKLSGRKIRGEYKDLEPGISDRIFVSDIARIQADWIRNVPLDKAIMKIIELNNKITM